jgi:hypothetical protein
MVEDYDSEDMDDSQDLQGDGAARQANPENLLNYESDDSDDADDASDDLGGHMQAQKEAAQRPNDTWGKHKKGYYQASSEEDGSQSEDEDQLNEAKRLQEIRSKKLAKQFKA